VQSRKGRLELAHEGTLFLDEVGDLSADAQAKLLRAVETGEAERVGRHATERYDVRFIAATNKDLPPRSRPADPRGSVLPAQRPAITSRRCANAAPT